MKTGPFTREHRATRAVPEANGRSHVDIECPFCGTVVVAYLWSLAGCGKRCPGPSCKDTIHYMGNYSIDRHAAKQARAEERAEHEH